MERNTARARTETVEIAPTRTLFAPTPAELRDLEQRTWFARQQRLVEER